MDVADVIWNRAITDGGGDSPGPGDRALAIVLAFHGLVLDAGVIEAVACTSGADLAMLGVAFQWLGLGQVAGVLGAVRREISAGALDDEDSAEAADYAANRRYDAIVPSVAVLERAFLRRLGADPGAFASP